MSKEETIQQYVELIKQNRDSDSMIEYFCNTIYNTAEYRGWNAGFLKGFKIGKA